LADIGRRDGKKGQGCPYERAGKGKDQKKKGKQRKKNGRHYWIVQQLQPNNTGFSTRKKGADEGKKKNPITKAARRLAERKKAVWRDANFSNREARDPSRSEEAMT